MGACSGKIDLLDSKIDFSIDNEQLVNMLQNRKSYNKRSREAIQQIAIDKIKRDNMPLDPPKLVRQSGHYKEPN